jgi:glutamyl-Q tRNA(Asp) synthetase
MTAAAGTQAAYVGRFAPSPTGPLHRGSLVAAVGSWLDARAHGGRWLVRIEDVDTPRCVPGADRTILRQLEVFGLVPDAPPLWQSRRGDAYAEALARLAAAGAVYPCRCSRSTIARALAAAGVPRARHQSAVYPGLCRPPYAQAQAFDAGARGSVAWRLRVEPGTRIDWVDRRLGAQQQDVAAEVGDFVLRRADGLWAYQLAVVVDDAQQGVTHIVRGEDLADNSARQMLLQRRLGLPTPRYLHLPLVRDAQGEKLSKQTGAAPLDEHDPAATLRQALAVLGIDLPAAAADAVPAQLLQAAVPRWAQAYPPRRGA